MKNFYFSQTDRDNMNKLDLPTLHARLEDGSIKEYTFCDEVGKATWIDAYKKRHKDAVFVGKGEIDTISNSD